MENLSLGFDERANCFLKESYLEWWCGNKITKFQGLKKKKSFRHPDEKVSHLQEERNQPVWLLPATSTKFWEKYIMSSYDVIQLLKQKSDSLKYDCIYTFYEFFLGKVIV